MASPKPLQDVPFEGTCGCCGKMFKFSPMKRWAVRHSIAKRIFCSRGCYHKSMKGEGNPKWRGGKTVVDGYVYVYCPGHPFATHHGYVAEHRLVMEKIIGRYLLPEETIHHIDGDTENNSPENLRLFSSEGEHRRLHAKYRTWDEKGRFLGHKEGVIAYV